MQAIILSLFIMATSAVGQLVIPSSNLFDLTSVLSTKKACQNYKMAEFLVEGKPFTRTIQLVPGVEQTNETAVLGCYMAGGTKVKEAGPEVRECFDLTDPLLPIPAYGKPQCPQDEGKVCVEGETICGQGLDCFGGLCQKPLPRSIVATMKFSSTPNPFGEDGYQKGVAWDHLDTVFKGIKNSCSPQIIAGWVSSVIDRSEVVVLAGIRGHCSTPVLQSDFDSAIDLALLEEKNKVGSPFAQNVISKVGPTSFTANSDLSDCQNEHTQPNPNWTCGKANGCSWILCEEGAKCEQNSDCGSQSCRTDPNNSAQKVCTLRFIPDKNVFTLASKIVDTDSSCSNLVLGDILLKGTPAGKVVKAAEGQLVGDQDILMCIVSQVNAGNLIQIDEALLDCFTEGPSPVAKLGSNGFCPQKIGGVCTTATVCESGSSCVEGVCTAAAPEPVDPNTRIFSIVVRSKSAPFDGQNLSAANLAVAKAITAASTAEPSCTGVSFHDNIGHWVVGGNMLEFVVLLPVKPACAAELANWKAAFDNDLVSQNNDLSTVKMDNVDSAVYDNCALPNNGGWGCAGAQPNCSEISCNLGQACQEDAHCGTSICKDSVCVGASDGGNDGGEGGEGGEGESGDNGNGNGGNDGGNDNGNGNGGNDNGNGNGNGGKGDDGKGNEEGSGSQTSFSVLAVTGLVGVALFGISIV